LRLSRKTVHHRGSWGSIEKKGTEMLEIVLTLRSW